MMRRALFESLIYVAIVAAVFAAGELLLRGPACDRCGQMMHPFKLGSRVYQCPGCGSQIDITKAN